METKIIDNRLFAKVDSLSFWDKNEEVRQITDANFKKLVASIHRVGILDEIKVGEDGVVYDGNHRLKALHELLSTQLTQAGNGISLEWAPVVIVHPQNEAEKWEIALTGNSTYATWTQDLANYMPEFEDFIDTSLLNVDFIDPKSIEEQILVDEAEPTDEEKLKKPQKEITCPSCGHMFTP